MWRRTLDDKAQAVVTLCNACGLYYKSKKVHRPTLLVSKKKSLSTSELIDKLIVDQQSQDKIVLKNIDLHNLSIIHCANCHNINTSIWRKDDLGRNICNACGLYYKKRGHHRAINKTKNEMASNNNDVFLEIEDSLIRFNRIKRRKRSSTSSKSSTPDSSVTATPDLLPATTAEVETPTPQVERSPELQPSPASPLSKPEILLTPLLPSNNYSLTRHNSIGSIDQYHYDYSSKQYSTQSQSQVRSLAHSQSTSLPPIAQNIITLPPIRSILNI
jgi:transcription elongation factor Elf1